jgi:hypothetical protein
MQVDPFSTKGSKQDKQLKLFKIQVLHNYKSHDKQTLSFLAPTAE